MKPEGLFETILVRGGAPVLLGPHLDRLRGSASTLSLAWPADLPAECRQAARGLPSGRMRIVLRPDGAKVLAEPFDGYPEAVYREGGVAEIATARGHPLGPLAGMKILPRTDLAEIRDLARNRGALDVVLTDEDGALLEGCASNVFVVRGGILRTPPLSRPVLPGIVRGAVLEAAAEAGLEAREEDLFEEDLAGVEEAFLTGSLMEMAPLRRLGRQELRPGIVARKLLEMIRCVT